jgi:hypothetical protein
MITPVQAGRLYEQLYPHVNYLLRLQKRMEDLRLQRDPLYHVVRDAYNAVWRLTREAHSRSCGH